MKTKTELNQELHELRTKINGINYDLKHIESIECEAKIKLFNHLLQTCYKYVNDDNVEFYFKILKINSIKDSESNYSVLQICENISVEYCKTYYINTEFCTITEISSDEFNKILNNTCNNFCNK